MTIANEPIECPENGTRCAGCCYCDPQPPEEDLPHVETAAAIPRRVIGEPGSHVGADEVWSLRGAASAAGGGTASGGAVRSP